MASSNGTVPTVAVVLPGGGTRGAYEAGAMSLLLPALAARGERISIYCGTSVGAINAAFYASLAHLPADEAAARGMATWSAMRKQDVVRPIVGPGLPVTALRLLGDMLGIPGVRLASLLDAAPLEASLEGWIDWLALYRNVRNGLVDAACVVATGLQRGGPVAFVQSRRAVPAAARSREIRYLRVALGPEHVRASAAIPGLFPAVEITRPEAARDHYIDGGTRLNSPIKPALALGAERVIVIGFEPVTAGPSDPVEPPGRPHLSDVLANVLDGLLLDRVTADLQRLVAVNAFYAETPDASASLAYRRARGREPYRKIAYALVSPESRGEVGRIAGEVYEERYGGLRGLRDLDFPVMSRLLGGGRSRARGELLSFLMFDERFVARLIELGRRDAQRWLDRHPRFWCTDAAHDFGVKAADPARVHEEQVLSEWRELRRR